MEFTSVVGVNWGDEGKGRIVDFLSEHHDVVIRYQGGNNAGHTVKNAYGTFKLHLIPSGVFHDGVINVLGPGMVIDLEELVKEIEEISNRISKKIKLHISDQATILFPFHRILDSSEEERLGSKQYGSTQRGIAPAYGDRYMKKSLKISDLLDSNYMRERIVEISQWANLLLVNIYEKEPVSSKDMFEWVEYYGAKIRPMIINVESFIQSKKNSKFLFEAQLGALRDVDYGIYPYTSSSSCLSSNILVGGGALGEFPQRVIGVMKAYSTCIGEGPFVTELFGSDAEWFRQQGQEYGAATGRPRRVGHFDAVASRHGVQLQRATEIALTKLDVLSGLKELMICTNYEINSNKSRTFPYTKDLRIAKPVYEMMNGWDEDIRHVRDFINLPNNAQKYVLRLEELIESKIKYISVGPGREEIIER